MGSVHEFADLDGDSNLEIVLLLKSKAATGSTPRELRVLSLANGGQQRHRSTKTPLCPPGYRSVTWTAMDARK